MKKKIITVALSGLMVTNALAPVFASSVQPKEELKAVLYAETPILYEDNQIEKVTLYDNKEIKPILYEKEIMAPMREICNALHIEVEWDEKTRTVTGKKLGQEMKLTIGDNKVIIDGKEIKLNTPVKIENHRTIVPLALFNEILGYDVDYDKNTKKISINTIKNIKGVIKSIDRSEKDPEASGESRVIVIETEKGDVTAFISVLDADILGGYDNIKEGAKIELIGELGNDNIVVAKSVILQEYLNIEGNVTKIEKNEDNTRILIEGERTEENLYDKIYLNITKNTKILDESGKKLNIEDIEEGGKIQAFYGPIVTRSMPPIGSAEKIILKK